MPKNKDTNKILGLVFIIVLGIAAALVIYLYWISEKETVYQTPPAIRLPAQPEQETEEETVLEWTQYTDDEISFQYPKQWYLNEQDGFLVCSSWDSYANPQAEAGGMKLVIGSVKSDMGLEQYVSNYLTENVNSDPDFTLIARKPTVLGAQPAVLVQSSTSLEGGAVIESIFTERDGRIWSVDLVGRVLNKEFQDIFDQIAYSFIFIDNNIINNE